MTTTTLPSHLGRTRRLTVIAAACLCGFLGLGAVAAGAGTAGAAHPGGGPTSNATPTATTTTVRSTP